MKVIGLTGNYGMGKSTVAKMFEELGAIVIDTDAIVRELLTEEPVVEMIRETFGDDVIIEYEGKRKEVDKKKLADIIFNDPYLRISLENIIHPIVFERVDDKLSQIKNKKGTFIEQIVIVEAPLIFERGYQNRFDKIITVFTDEDTAIKRLSQIGVLESEVKKRLNNQFPIKMKIERSDFVIDNSKGLDFTKSQVVEIYRKILFENRNYGNN
jgi:dephospho-CoA kinase